MMDSILVLAHSDEAGERLSRGSLETVALGEDLASKLGASLTVGIVSEDPAAVAPCLASAKARIIAVSGKAFAQPRFASDAAACEALCRAANASIVLAPHSSRFARVMAAVAHRMQGCLDTHITAVSKSDKIEATRWFYRQRMEAVVTRSARPWFLLLDP